MSLPNTPARAGMLQPRRRFFSVVAFALIAAPLVVGLVRPDSKELIYKEGRRLAPAPTAPKTLEGLKALPDQVDAYLKDHFGLRSAMINLHRDLSHPLLIKGNSEALIGRDGRRMYYMGNDMIRQSAGLVLRDQRVADAADLLAAMRDALAKRGIRFLVTVPPNASTIYDEDLPEWAQRHGRVTEYDLFLQDLKARGVKTVDLRPVLTKLRADQEAYLLYDAHWTARGAIAGFNAVVEADGHPEWRIDPATAVGPPESRSGGDVARMLGAQDEVSEMVEPLSLSQKGKDQALTEEVMPDHVVTTGKPGPTILVIGDSFTTGYFPIMLSQNVGRAIWMHHRECGFDWKAVEAFHPDEVWWAPTERFIVCDLGVKPKNFGGHG